jgi:hypothetical protein
MSGPSLPDKANQSAKAMATERIREAREVHVELIGIVEHRDNNQAHDVGSKPINENLEEHRGRRSGQSIGSS